MSLFKKNNNNDRNKYNLQWRYIDHKDKDRTAGEWKRADDSQTSLIAIVRSRPHGISHANVSISDRIKVLLYFIERPLCGEGTGTLTVLKVSIGQNKGLGRSVRVFFVVNHRL